jgi:hypothetical protein
VKSSSVGTNTLVEVRLVKKVPSTPRLMRSENVESSVCNAYRSAARPVLVVRRETQHQRTGDVEVAGTPDQLSAMSAALLIECERRRGEEEHGADERYLSAPHGVACPPAQSTSLLGRTSHTRFPRGLNLSLIIQVPQVALAPHVPAGLWCRRM